MQIFAEENGTPILATSARPSQNYLCPECRGIVRVRGGKGRRIHFFHLHAKKCRQAGRGPEHLELQHALKNLLPGSRLECRFPAIGRIADVAWEETKTIFEIQVSPITSEEVKARTESYESLGWKVIWILHEKTFRKWRETPAERFLRTRPHYYTNFSKKGVGIIYDHIRGGSPRFPVDLSAQVPANQSLPIRSEWPFFHRGDLIDRALQGTFRPKKQKRPKRSFYKALFYALLELGAK